MQRIQPVQPPYTEAMQKDFEVVMPPGIPPLMLFRTVGRNPRVLSRMMRGGLLDRGSISLRVRELMILRTCALCNCRYEWGVHATAFGGRVGLTPAHLKDIVQPAVDPTLWEESELRVFALAESLHREMQCSDELWQALREHFEEEQLIELVALAGAYHGVSFLANALKVQSEPFAYPYPEVVA